MSDQPRLWIRHETRQTERRAPIVPDDARRLLEKGFAVTVEESAQRAFPISAYADAGCRIVPAGSWTAADRSEIIVGLKELPVLPDALVHRHVFFGHAYKGQDGARELLRRFAVGGGTLLDIEYLVDGAGRRLAAFGYWAGYVGAALAVLAQRGDLEVPLRPRTRAELDALLARGAAGAQPRVLVIGALGRCGQGARAALEVAGISATGWDVAETRELDKAALLEHDVLINTVLTTRPVPPFVTHDDLDGPRRLSLICDVTCDVTSALNVLPIYTSVTSWPEPVRRLRGGDRPADLIAIDNLPSLLPAEASVAFSADLTEQLLGVDGDPVWDRCAAVFRTALAAAGLAKEDGDA